MCYTLKPRCMEHGVKNVSTVARVLLGVFGYIPIREEVILQTEQ
jgi:hypothetical protein